jgi:hypothetical protein
VSKKGFLASLIDLSFTSPITRARRAALRLVAPVCALALFCSVPPVADAATPSATLVFASDHVVRLGKFRPSHPTIAAAQAHFGEYSNSRELFGGSSCVIEWRNIGLAIKFADYGSSDACGATGLAQSVTIKGRGARAAFRTAAGLRVGDPQAHARALYPRAERHGSTWWLAQAKNYIGSCNGCPYGVVTAKITKGHVSSLHAWIGAAGD